MGYSHSETPPTPCHKNLINPTGFGQATKPYCLQYYQYPSSINICRKFRHINASAPLNEQSAHDNPPSYGESPMHIISLIQQKLCQIRTILPSHTSNQSLLHISLNTPINDKLLFTTIAICHYSY